MYLFLAVLGLHCCTRASHCSGFSCCGARTLGSRAQQLWLAGYRAQAQQLWRMDLVAPRHVGSSRTRGRTCVPCIGRRILNHCTTREALAALQNYLGSFKNTDPQLQSKPIKSRSLGMRSFKQFPRRYYYTAWGENHQTKER